MVDAVRIQPLDYAKAAEKQQEAKQFLCEVEKTAITLCTSLCPAMVCIDGMAECDLLLVERFHGCGFGTGGVPHFEAGKQVQFCQHNNIHVFCLPGRYRIFRPDGKPIDPDQWTIEVSDLTFEWAMLWATANKAQGGCHEHG